MKDGIALVKNTILYYPTISIPSTKWLRQALLYWDEIGSIIPRRYDENPLVSYSADLDFLRSEGEFRPFDTSILLEHPDYEIVTEFETEFLDRIAARDFQASLPPLSERSLASRIHRDKVNYHLAERLQALGLATSREKDYDWFYFEDGTALLYMAILAKFLAIADSQITVAGTDRPDYELLSLGSWSSKNPLPGLTVQLFNLLPVPREDVAFPDILAYKRRHQDTLRNFRQMLNDAQAKLRDSQSQAQAKDVLHTFHSSLQKGLTDLNATMKDARLATTAGTLEAVVKASTPGWVASGLVASGQFSSISAIPIEWTLGATAVSGTIGLFRYAIDERNKRRAAQRNSPLSYICGASREGLLA